MKSILRILQSCVNVLLMYILVNSPCNITTLFRNLMMNDVLNLRKEVAWALSNITAGNVKQIQSVIDAGLLPPLIELIQHGDVKSQKEATWAVSNFTCGGSVEHIALLVREGTCPIIQ